MLSRFTGCLLGLAAGDCLGASVESWTAEDIRRRYGRLTDRGQRLLVLPAHRKPRGGGGHRS
ncbi:MAG: ADP-ribosylglycohydrolase family protein [Dehalococcoidia bacterium]